MLRNALPALLCACAFAAAPSPGALAADLSEACCGDLEERVAELEATAARKGNRKVSLSVSGWVAQQITYWDDGVESNLYVHDLGTTLASHVQFTGQAAIAPGWSAGYVLYIEAIGSDGLTINAETADGPALLAGKPNAVQVLQSYWFLKSDHLGKVSVGMQSQASDNTAMLVDGSGSMVPANWMAFDVNNFAVRNNGGIAVTWGGAAHCGTMGGAWGDCNGLPRNVVRYDSPIHYGFSVSASWGEDDMWDVAGHYESEHAGFRISAAVAYNEVTDEVFNGSGIPGDTGRYFQAGLYVEHIETGLFGLVDYGRFATELADGDAQTWYVKGGIRQNWNALGASVLYGEWEHNHDTDFWVAGITPKSTFEMFGAGVVQEIDNAAMSVWVKYRHMSYTDHSAITFEDFDEVGVGALIEF